VLLPIYLGLLGWFKTPAALTLIYTLVVAGLMVSRLPVFSGKRVGKRIPPEAVLPVIVVFVLFFALLIAYPWQVLTIGTVFYLAALPLGWLSYREHERKDRVAATVQRPEAVDTDQTMPPQPPAQPERPARLN
jgi:CDP-diacylglycerol--serine O-phosphatidyltransferase